MNKHTLKFCGVHTARFLKYVWSFLNIMKERVNEPTIKSHLAAILEAISMHPFSFPWKHQKTLR